MSSQAVLILGAGARVGKSLAQRFASEGFRVAVASRSLDPALVEAVDTSMKADFSNPSSIKDVFTWAKSSIGVPTVVIYNGSTFPNLQPYQRLTLPAFGNTMGAPFSAPLSQFEADLAVNTSSVYVAIQEALSGFESLKNDSPKTFIFTGNRLNIEPMPVLLSMGAGKTATAHLIQAAAMTFEDQGYG